MIHPTATKTKVAVAMGDGIGPEIMKAVIKILDKAGASWEPAYVELGEKVYLQGVSSGIAPDTWETLRDCKVLLKAPITTPLGGGYKSLNVTLRKSLSLFANVRPTRSLHPYVETHFPNIDVVIVRENEEDLYAAIEHQQTEDVVQCLKLITRPGCERIVRYAFEYAIAHGRKRVTCMTKDNIMKLTDGLFHRVFEEVAVEYPQIKSDHMIIDIGTARLAADPESFDVVVTPNLYGDIVSDVVAQVAGSVGMAGSANVGKEFAMFEAIHGSAPDISGQGIANPSGLLNAAIMMLEHLEQFEVAKRIEHAWKETIEAGIHTRDIFREKTSKALVSTEEFAEAVIARLPEKAVVSSSAESSSFRSIDIPGYQRPQRKKELVGVDVFIDWQGDDPNVLGAQLEGISKDLMKLKMITNRGVKVYPDGLPETFCTDHWRCRFVDLNATSEGKEKRYPVIGFDLVLSLLTKLNAHKVDLIKTENLYEFDRQRGFSLGQGE